MKVTILLGSVRKARDSHRPAYYISDLLRARGTEVEFIDLRELALPVYEESAEQDALPAAKRFLELIIAAEALVIVTPEYNHNVGPALLNALCYLRHRELLHKPVGLVTASNGQISGARATLILRGSLPTLGAVLLPTAVNVPVVAESFTELYTCTNQKVEKAIEAMLKELFAYAPALTEIRKQLVG